MDLETVADELYAAIPEEFIALRTAREKAAKAAGDAQLAGEIRGFTKPNTVGWLANQLVREHRDQLEPLLELGAELRAATAVLSGDELRTLGRQQHQLIYALVQQARAIARVGGRKVSDDTARGLEATLHAALADEAAAAELLAGRLTAGLQRGGFTPAEDAPPPAPPRPTRAAPAREASVTSLEQHRAEQRERAEREVRLAEDDAAAADEALRSVRAEVEANESSLEQAKQNVTRRQTELDEANEHQAEVERQQRQLRTSVERADRDARQATNRLESARARAARLS